MATFHQLLTHFVAKSLEKQLAFADFLNGADWQADLATGYVLFEGVGRFPLQLLGSESDYDGTWLWAWDNPSITNPGILREARRLQSYGQEKTIAAFTTPLLEDQQITGHHIALVASGLCRAGAYYRGPYDGGAVYFLVNEVSLPTADNPRIVQVILQTIANFAVAHQPMLEAYLSGHQFEIQKTPTTWQATKDGQMITLAFDSEGRLKDLSTTFNPA